MDEDDAGYILAPLEETGKRPNLLERDFRSRFWLKHYFQTNISRDMGWIIGGILVIFLKRCIQSKSDEGRVYADWIHNALQVKGVGNLHLKPVQCIAKTARANRKYYIASRPGCVTHEIRENGADREAGWWRVVTRIN